jgi:hypothetical protein
MMSSRFLQAKSCTTILSPSVTVAPDVARSILHPLCFTQNEEVGTESGWPKWLLPGYRILATSPSGLAARRWLRSPIGFEIRFLYAHGSAQVGFSPFYD